jgi:uncharacterized protein YndB with AHSA1/START domain
VDIRSDRTYRFDHPPDAVWAAIGRVDAFQSWWPWLRRFEAEALVAGDRWDCTIRPPVPYALHVTVALDEVEAPRRIRATVSGDIHGTAAVTLEETPGGSALRLVSELAPHGQTLRHVTRWAPWLSRFGHDWVLDTGLRQFRSRAL